MLLQYKIKFEEGLHSRAAINLTNLTRKHRNSSFTIIKINDKDVIIKCNSLISILSSNIQCEDIIELSVVCDATIKSEIKKELDMIFGE